MGGVLVELGPLTSLLGDDPLPPDQFWASWLASPTVRDFEMGGCTVEEFGERLVVELGLSTSGASLVERFGSWPLGLFPGARQLIDDLRSSADPHRGLEIAVLSNTNALHWDNQPEHHVVKSLFTRRYLSFEIGLAKPDRAIFEHVLEDLAVKPGQVVFLDDNQINVDGARAVGIDAVLARGVGEARTALAERNLLDGSA